jgi:serine/threonine protein phosphatase PrpC
MTILARDHTGRPLHKVTTTRSTPPLARCGLCGWSEIADPPGGRAEARALARHHLDRPPTWPVFRLGQASRIGGRTVNADHSAVFVDDALGEVVAWAVADGIGDRPGAAEAAHLAADTAVRMAFGHRLGAVDALLAAGDLLREHQERTGSSGDAVMVLAIARGEPDEDGYELAWVGDCRGYEQRAGQLVQLTVDHTAAEAERARIRENYGDLATAPDWLIQRTSRLEHIVTTSVATATADEIGTVSTVDQRARLVLTSDGVHKPVPHTVLTELATGTADPRRAAHLLTLAGARHGGTDNATALVIDPAYPA